jgi:hypothetical protein
MTLQGGSGYGVIFGFSTQNLGSQLIRSFSAPADGLVPYGELLFVGTAPVEDRREG